MARGSLLKPALGACLLAASTPACGVALGDVAERRASSGAEFRLVRYERAVEADANVAATVRGGKSELHPGATLSVQASDTCGEVSGGAAGAECELAVDTLSELLEGAGYRVVHHEPLLAARQAAALRDAVETIERRSHPTEDEHEHVEPPPAPAPPTPALGVEHVLLVDQATLSEAELEPTTLSLAQFEADASGKAGVRLADDRLRPWFEAFARQHPPAAPRDAVATVHVSLVTLATGDVSLHYEGRTRGGAALSAVRRYLFRLDDAAPLPVKPLPPLPALPELAASQQVSPRSVFMRLGRDLVDQLTASAKVGL